MWAYAVPLPREREIVGNFFYHVCSRVEQVRINADIKALEDSLTDQKEKEICALLRGMLERRPHARLYVEQVSAKVDQILNGAR